MPVERIAVSWSLFVTIWKETFRGKSLARVFLNYALKELTLTGRVLDLGSRSNTASYHRFLKKHDLAEIVHTDMYQSGEGLVQMDLEQLFPLVDQSFEIVTCFNTLEHIFDFNNVAQESFRVLKTGGRYIGGTPFLVNYHPDPHDYFRYTPESIEKIFVNAGFKKEKIIFLGLGPCTAAAALSLHIFPKFLRWLIAWKAICLDTLILRFKPSQRETYALGYLYIFHKE